MDEETRKGSTFIGVLPFHLSPSWDNLSRSENRSAVLEVSARHKTAVGVRRSCGSTAARRDRQPACPLRIVAVGWQIPTCGAGVDRSFPRVREVSAHLPSGFPHDARSRRYSVVERISSSHIPRTQNTEIRTGLQTIFQIFFHVLQATLNSPPDSAFIHALFQRNLAIALALDDTSIHTATLCLGQRIDSVPQIVILKSSKTLYPTYQICYTVSG